MPKHSFSFDLSQPVLGVNRLICYEPTNAHRSLTCPMTSMLLKAMTSVKPDDSKPAKKEETSSDITYENIMMLLQVSPGQSSEFYYEFFDKFKALMLSSNICMLDNNKGMDKVTFDNMLVSDTDKLLGTYVINFILPSDFLTKAD